MEKKKDKEKIWSGETGMLFSVNPLSINVLPVGDTTCDVCDKPMYDDVGREEIAVAINIWDHPEADRVLKIFGKQRFNVCFLCFLRALGVKEKRTGEKKDELKADQGLKQLGIEPRIYLFEENIKPFMAITIAEDRRTWAGVRRELNNIIPRVSIYPYGKATRLREELRRIDVYGVAICDSQEPNKNVRRGRTIAKGRLLKHLRKIGVRKVER